MVSVKDKILHEHLEAVNHYEAIEGKFDSHSLSMVQAAEQSLDIYLSNHEVEA